MEDDEGLNNLLEACTNLERLILRDCSLSPKTLTVLFKNCHHIRELSLSSNMSETNLQADFSKSVVLLSTTLSPILLTGAVLDDAVILLSKNLHLLEVVDLSWNTGAVSLILL